MACVPLGHSRPRDWRVAFFPLLLGLAAGIGPASAEKVGVAAAVNPDAYTSRGGQINIGNSIFYNERISTTGSGLVQVLLVDGSTFTVGPGSNLVIDRFVYNPKKQTGEVVATFSKGAIRYVGGKISKNEDGVTIKTPNGSLAVRGGVVQGTVSGTSVLFSFLFGKEMVFTGNNGKTYTVFQPGYTLDLSGEVVKVRPTTPADIAKIMAALTNSYTTTAGSGEQQTGEGNTAVSQLTTISNDIADLINQATTNQIQAELQAELLRLLFQLPPDTPVPPNTPITPVVTPVMPITPITPIPTTPPVTETLSGYAALTLVSISDILFANALVGVSPEDFGLTFNSGTQLGHANMIVHDVFNHDPGADTYRFSIPIAPTAAGLPGHIGDFGTEAIGNGFPLPFASSNGAFFVVNPEGGAVLCTKCDFMKWGLVGMTLETGLNSPTQFVDIVTGFWIAGDLPTIGELPSSGTASYAGNTIGIVAFRSSPYSSDWASHAAQGTVDMTWNFASRTGNLAISNFDAGGPLGTHNFSGTMNMSGANSAVNRFQGNLAGSLDGVAHGSFARKGSDAAAGVLGNWAAQTGTGTYRATGIFGAAR